METTVAAGNRRYAFEDRNIRWYKLGDFEHFVFAMFDVDESRRIHDFILKLPPNQRIFLHRQLALTNTLTVQGEHRLYEPGRAPKEVRPVGTYTSSPPGEPHRAGGRDESAVVSYNVRAEDHVLFKILHDDRLGR